MKEGDENMLTAYLDQLEVTVLQQSKVLSNLIIYSSHLTFNNIANKFSKIT